jgi:aspartate aminotransferase/aminotransferase
VVNEAYRQRRDAVVDLLRSAGLLISIPAGAFYVMADISPTDLTSTDFAFHLLRERKVSVAPGSAFGDVARNAVRISLASSDADLEAGVSHLCKLAQELSR